MNRKIELLRTDDREEIKKELKYFLLEKIK